MKNLPDKIYLATTEEIQNLDNTFVGIAHSNPEDTDFGVCWGEYCDCGGNINDYKVAKHFFELGMQAAQKGE